MSQIKSARAECSNATTAMYVQVQVRHARPRQRPLHLLLAAPPAVHDHPPTRSWTQALHTECELERRSLEQLSHLLNITRQKLDVARAQMQVDRCAPWLPLPLLLRA